MKTSKKVAIALLTVGCLTAGAFGLTACGGGSSPEIGENGNWYVDGKDTEVPATGPAGSAGAAGTNGSDGKSAYEIWLDAGNTGDETAFLEWLKGATGPKGDQGETGKGIDRIEYSADGKALLIYYTGETTPVKVELPSVQTHEHVYGNIIVITPATADHEGLGYQICKEDGHNELVVLPKTPELKSGVYELKGEGRFTVTMTSASQENLGKAQLKLSAGAAAVKYRVTVESEYGIFKLGENNENTSFDVVLDAGESSTFELATDLLNLPSEDYPLELPYIVKVEQLATPARGIKELPIYVNSASQLGKDVTAQVGADEWVYYAVVREQFLNDSWVPHNDWKWTFGDGITVQYLGAIRDDDSLVPVISAEKFTFNVGASDAYVYFKVKATDGNVSFKLEKWFREGDKNNPKAAELNMEYTGEVGYIGGESRYEDWYKYTATQSGKVTFEQSIGKTSIEDYDNGNTTIAVYSDSVNGTSVASSEGGEAVLVAELTEGTTYYIKATTDISSGTYKFRIRAHESADDQGNSKDAPVTITNGTEYSATAAKGVKYYAMPAVLDGARVHFAVKDAQGNSLTVQVGYDFDVTDPDVRIEHVAYDKYEGIYDTGETVLIKVTYYGGTDYKLTVTQDAFTEVDHKVTVMCGENPVGAGVVVIFKDGQTEIARATTDEKGVATVNALPGEYYIYLESEKYQLYVSNEDYRPKTSFRISGADDFGTETTVSQGLDWQGKPTLYNVEEKQEMTFTVKNGNDTLQGVTVKVYGEDKETPVASAITDTDGTCKISLFAGSYTIEVEGLTSEYAYVNKLTLTHDGMIAAQSCVVEIAKYVTYSVKVVYDVDGVETPVSGATVALSGVEGDPATTDDQGVASINAPAGVYNIVLGGSLPEGYFGNGVTSATQTDITIKLLLPKTVNGSEEKESAAVLPAKGMVKAINSSETGYYKYVATATGTYTFTLTNMGTSACYIQSLYYNMGWGEDLYIKDGKWDFPSPDIKIIEEDKDGKATKITFNLLADGYLIFVLNSGAAGDILMNIEAPAGVTDETPDNPDNPDDPVQADLSTGANQVLITEQDNLNWGKELIFIGEANTKYTLSVDEAVASVAAGTGLTDEIYIDTNEGQNTYDFTTDSTGKYVFYVTSVTDDTQVVLTITEGGSSNGGNTSGEEDNPNGR